jgi:hypothetical protein
LIFCWSGRAIREQAIWHLGAGVLVRRANLLGRQLQWSVSEKETAQVRSIVNYSSDVAATETSYGR